MKKVLIINGHPDPESFNAAIVASYEKGARESGAEVQMLAIGTLAFQSSLLFGYRVRTELEPGLLEAQEKIRWADHLVWVFPTWWGGLPAVLKGFIDRVFLPGFAFKYEPGHFFPKKLLKGKSARIITTMDAPAWVYRFVYFQPGVNQLKKPTLQFSGVGPIRTTLLTSMKNSTPERRAAWLAKIETMGAKLR